MAPQPAVVLGHVPVRELRSRQVRLPYGIIDLVSRKWIASIVGPEATSTQVRILFLKALEAEGLLNADIRDRLATLDETIADGDDDEVPLLLAMSDNGTEMKSRDTRKSWSPARSPGTSGAAPPPPTKPGSKPCGAHIKPPRTRPSWPSPTPPPSPSNSNGPGSTTTASGCTKPSATSPPNDEHEGRGDTIRAARRTGLDQADHDRRHWHRTQRNQP